MVISIHSVTRFLVIKETQFSYVPIWLNFDSCFSAFPKIETELYTLHFVGGDLVYIGKDKRGFKEHLSFSSLSSFKKFLISKYYSE